MSKLADSWNGYYPWSMSSGMNWRSVSMMRPKGRYCVPPIGTAGNRSGCGRQMVGRRKEMVVAVVERTVGTNECAHRLRFRVKPTVCQSVLRHPDELKIKAYWSCPGTPPVPESGNYGLFRVEPAPLAPPLYFINGGYGVGVVVKSTSSTRSPVGISSSL